MTQLSQLLQLLHLRTSTMRCARSPRLKAGVRALLQDGKPQSLVRRAFATEAHLSTPPSKAPSSAFEDALSATTSRNSWTKEQIKEIYDTPLMQLAFAAVSQSTEHCISPVRYGLTRTGHRPPEIPQPRLNTDVHSHEHQNWWLLRGLFVLCSIIEISDRPQGFQDGHSRVRTRCC